MNTIEEQLTDALRRRDAELTVHDELDAIINDDHIIRFTPQRHNRSRRPLLLTAAAAAMLVIGAGGLFWAQRSEPVPPATASQSTASVDPVAQLYVLPTDAEGLELSDGEVFTALDDGALTPSDVPVLLIGTETDDGFSDLVDVRVFDTIPDGFGGDDVTEVDTPTGLAFTGGDGFPFGAVTQQRGDEWLLLSGTSDNQDLIDLLSQLSIDPSGMPSIDSRERVVVDQVGRQESAADTVDGVFSTFYRITDPTSGITFEVETATAPSAALLGTYTQNPIKETTVNGTAAWILTRDDESAGPGNVGVAWRATPNRVIAIGAQAPLDHVQAMAERLQQVTEEDWLAALPEATIRN
jgi:hypothetical protein